jgi:hypothetical protein
LTARDFNTIRKEQPAAGGVHITTAIGNEGKKKKPTATEETKKFSTFCKADRVDTELGLVFGWGMVSSEDGKDYIDVQGDHCTDAFILKTSADFMMNSRAGNEMHAGPDSGSYVFAFPLTKEIAKAFGIETKKFGLMLAYKPTPDVLAKFKDGTYTGFSIEGHVTDTTEI